jgi:hypothetical protein
MALQSNKDLLLLYEFLPVSPVFLPLFPQFPIVHLLISVWIQFHIPCCYLHLINSFHCSGRSHSVWLFRSHSLGFLTVSYFSVTRCRPFAQPPTWRASSPYLYLWGSVTQLYPKAMGTHFGSVDCSETNFFPIHHTGNLYLFTARKLRWL